MKLNQKQIEILRLVQRTNTTAADGWTIVSRQLWPVMVNASVPADLLEIKASINGGIARLTQESKILLKWL